MPAAMAIFDGEAVVGLVSAVVTQMSQVVAVRDVRPDLRLDVMEAGTERLRVLGVKDLGIGIVVEKAEFLAPGDEHRELGAEQQADN